MSNANNTSIKWDQMLSEDLNDMMKEKVEKRLEEIKKEKIQQRKSLLEKKRQMQKEASQ